MSRTRQAACLAALLAACGLGLIGLALEPGGARAQMQAPPFGWDMWGPGWTPPDAWQSERLHQGLSSRLTRQQAFLRDGVPAAYRDAQNPFARTPATVLKGGAIYAERCAACHDPAGMGHGDGGLALYPSPALLADLVRMPHGADEYLLWAISEGGAPFGTKMPAFKDALTREQIWQVITYMRAGFPAPSTTGQP
jgi:mono/diheme cytochrome c family protein